MARLNERGVFRVKGLSPICEITGLPPARVETVLGSLVRQSVITDYWVKGTEQFVEWDVSREAVCIAQRIDIASKERAAPDIVERAKRIVRGNRVTGWIIVGFLALSVFVTVLNQVLGILKTLKVIE